MQLLKAFSQPPFVYTWLCWKPHDVTVCCQVSILALQAAIKLKVWQRVLPMFNNVNTPVGTGLEKNLGQSRGPRCSHGSSCEGPRLNVHEHHVMAGEGDSRQIVQAFLCNSRLVGQAFTPCSCPSKCLLRSNDEFPKSGSCTEIPCAPLWLWPLQHRRCEPNGGYQITVCWQPGRGKAENRKCNIGEQNAVKVLQGWSDACRGHHGLMHRKLARSMAFWRKEDRARTKRQKQKQ